MGKIILFFLLFYICLNAQELSVEDKQQLHKECLSCHVEQQIPNDLIYRRYLMVYSTTKRMEEAIFYYMQNPDKKNSVMHHPFFFKFPMKEKLNLNDEVLKKMIKSYLITFDLKKKFI